ncbi:MAG: hypothetical protein WEH44_05115 [Pirellulaceae bacterium]
MLRPLGKLMQVLGLILLPASMLMELTDEMRAPIGLSSVSAMLLLMCFGVALFGMGRIIEAYAGG